MRVIGLMSGTSLDGVDAAFVETDGERVIALGPNLTIAYDESLRARLRDLLDRAPTLASGDPELRDIERELTDRHAEAVAALESVAALAEPADLIGLHGQTILHRPTERRTWQIGDAQRLADRTGLPVVHDFRAADVEAGGEGAPFAPLFHSALLPSDLPRPIAILNLGGVANLTFLGQEDTVIAADTGPGNALLDDWALRHTGVPRDGDGALAYAGRIDEVLLRALLADPFFTRKPPKSLDRLDFPRALQAISTLSPEDGAATLTALTAAAVAACPLPSPPRAWFVCGGGRHNPALMAALRDRLDAPVEAVEALGWNGDALEAQCFAHLAARSQRGLPLSLPTTTGVPRPTPGGRMTRPLSA